MTYREMAASHDHPLNAGATPESRLGSPSEPLFFGIRSGGWFGCRSPTGHGQGEGISRQRKFIHIDIEPVADRTRGARRLGIVADVQNWLLAALLEERRAESVSSGAFRASATPARDPAGIGPQDRLRQRAHSSHSRVFQGNQRFLSGQHHPSTTGCGITQIWSGQLQNVDRPRRYLASGARALWATSCLRRRRQSGVPGRPGGRGGGRRRPPVHGGRTWPWAGQHKIPVLVIVVKTMLPGPDPSKPEIRVRL